MEFLKLVYAFPILKHPFKILGIKPHRFGSLVYGLVSSHFRENPVFHAALEFAVGESPP